MRVFFNSLKFQTLFLELIVKEGRDRVKDATRTAVECKWNGETTLYFH